MLMLGMLFGALVAGPLLVLGALAAANSDRAMAWLGAIWRSWRPAPSAAPPDDAQSAAGPIEATNAAGPGDGAPAR